MKQVRRFQNRAIPFLLLMVALVATGRAATPVHVYNAASASNWLGAGPNLVRWADVGPGHDYGSGTVQIPFDLASGVSQTAPFVTLATTLGASFTCDGIGDSGAKPLDEAQSSSLGYQLADGSIEIWFKADLDDEDRPHWQVLFESGARTNGYGLLLRTNGLGAAELRLVKTYSNVRVADLTVALEGIEDRDFIQVVATLDGDAAGDGDDAVRLQVRDVLGRTFVAEDLANDFNTLAGSDDACAFNAANNSTFGNPSNCGGNSGTTISTTALLGEIALIRFYSTALTPAEIDVAYGQIVDQGDSDGDLMPNYWERLHGLDPGDPLDAAVDEEPDGLDNLEEFQNGTDPRVADSDGDGLDDGPEIAAGSDPLDPDSDDDGLGDAFEVAANPYVTSPVLADTDGDLVPDPVELMVDTDPTDGGSLGSSVLITEFMASNGSTLDDEDGDSSDWIELLNPTGAAIDLGGLSLTDDPARLVRWTFPARVVLGPGEFLVVFASGKDRAVAGSELHTDFQLSAGGEYLALVDSDGSTVLQEFAPAYPEQQTDISLGLDGLYLTVPTPGAVNRRPGVSGFVEDTRFSVDRGFYSAPFEVQITTATAGATIVYTTDCSTPTLANGTQVPGRAPP